MSSRWSAVPRFRVRQVTTASTRLPLPAAFAQSTGTSATTVRYPLSFNELNRTVADFNSTHESDRGQVVGKGVGPKDEHGRHMAFRWVWERITPWGRVTDALFVTVDSWE